jgi:hypothetical protein
VFGQEQPRGIPTEVVSLIMQIGAMAGTADGELRAGGPPADFPVSVFPAGTVLNATVVSPSRGTTVVGTAASLTLPDFEKHETALVASGWTALGPRSRGFQIMQPTTQAPINVCRGADFLVLSPHVRAAGGIHVRATLTRDARRTCAAQPTMPLLNDIDLPRLTPPAGARSLGGGGSSGSLDSMTATTRLETALAVRAVAEHYERQLTAAGWKVAGRVRDGDAMSGVRFEVPSRIGAALAGWLSAMRLGASDDVDVFLRVVRTTRDPRTTFGAGGATSTLTPLAR